MSNKPLCIYHGNCVDGFGAAWVVRHFYGPDNVDFHPGVYQEPPPDVTGRHVILVDFSYKRPVLEQMIAQAASVTILDHHKTAQEDLAGLEDREDVVVRFDQKHSGAVIAWRHFFPQERIPTLLLHVEDRDLWKFALPRTREIAAALFSLPYDFEVWDSLIPDDEPSQLRQLRHLAEDGTAIERKHFKDVAELVTASARPMRIAGYEVLAANLPYTLSSDAGHELMERGSLFGACYFDSPNGRTFSLRSNDDGPDVSEIAKRYGGGGHRNAAGFRVPLTEIGQFEVAPFAQEYEPPYGFDLVGHLDRQHQFSEATFGPGKRTTGLIGHLLKEILEAAKNPGEIEEWIDIVILGFDGALRNTGCTPAQVMQALVAKQTKNESRKWPDWRTAAPDKAIEHIREEVVP